MERSSLRYWCAVGFRFRAFTDTHHHRQQSTKLKANVFNIAKDKYTAKSIELCGARRLLWRGSESIQWLEMNKMIIKTKWNWRCRCDFSMIKRESLDLAAGMSNGKRMIYQRGRHLNGRAKVIVSRKKKKSALFKAQQRSLKWLSSNSSCIVILTRWKQDVFFWALDIVLSMLTFSAITRSNSRPFIYK